VALRVVRGGVRAGGVAGGRRGAGERQDEKSTAECGAEVQKGNPLTERKIQRLFRIKEVAQMIIKCNDFGAGGVSVAIGELADSLGIDGIPTFIVYSDGKPVWTSSGEMDGSALVGKVEEYM